MQGGIHILAPKKKTPKVVLTSYKLCQIKLKKTLETYEASVNVFQIQKCLR